MRYRRAQGLTWLYSPAWEELGVRAAFSTRLGGFGTGPYNGLNLGLHVGDDRDTVLLNRQHWLRALDIEEEPCCARQVHGTGVAAVDQTHAGRGYKDYDDSLPELDGMVTDVPRLPLLTFYADCLPVYLFDPVQRAIGLVHSGWKGTAGHIARTAVELMASEYGSRPRDILAIIGPGIGRCCYQVGEEVAAIFRKEFAEHRQLLYSKTQKAHWHLDLKEGVRQTLIEAGVGAGAIEDAGICTCCRRDLYFSHRGEQGNTGRAGALIIKCSV